MWHQIPTQKYPNAINLERFQFDNTRTFEGSIKLVNVGSLMPNKNQQFLLDLVQQLKNKGKKVSLTLIGDGSTLPQLKEKAKELGIEAEVNFTGIVSNPEKYLNEAHIYVHSAWHEPFGLVLIEALSCGLPIVSFNTGGPKEIIHEGEDGYLVEKHDLSTFTDRVLKLADNQEYYTQFSEKAIASSKEYDIKHYADKLLAFYKK